MPYIGRNHIAGDHTSNFKVLDDISSHTATFNGSSALIVSTADETIRIPEHRFIQGQRVTYSNGGGGNIGGLTNGTAYFVTFDTHNTIKLATSLANANNNTNINLTSVGTGSAHTLTVAFDGVNTTFKATHNGGISANISNSAQLQIAINNVIQKINEDASYTEGFRVVDGRKIQFKTAPTADEVFWGNIIANTIETFDIADLKIDQFTGDGVTTQFTLSRDVPNNQSVMVTLDGVVQHPSDKDTTRAYRILAEKVIEFSSPPPNPCDVQVRHLGFAGASTADVSGFYGRTGNVVLGASDHITTGDITSRNINASGIVTASSFSGGFSGNIVGTSATFTGNLSVGGVLTYEDVTNVDSVGIITAQKDIHVGAGLSVVGVTTIRGNLNFPHANQSDANDGRIGSGTFGEGLNIVGTQTVSGNGRKVRIFGSIIPGQGGADLGTSALDATRFQFGYFNGLKVRDNVGNGLHIGDGADLKLYHTGNTSTISHNNGSGDLILDALQTGSDIRLRSEAEFQVQVGGSTHIQVYKNGGVSFNQAGTGAGKKLETISSGARVTGTLDVTDGITVAGNIDANGDLDVDGDIVISDSIVHSGDTDTKIRFSQDNNITLETSGSQRVRIDSLGRIGISQPSPQYKLDILETTNTRALYIKYGTSTNTTSGVQITNSSGAGNLYLGVWGPSAGAYGQVNVNDAFIGSAEDWSIHSISNTGVIKFGIGGSGPVEKMRITSTGVNVSGVATATSFVPTTGQLSHRNIIVNGDMNVAQRGTQSTSDGIKTVDRFGIGFQTGAIQQDQITLTSSDTPYAHGFRKSYRLTNTTASTASSVARDIRYQIEAQDIATSGWDSTSASSYITLSFWVKASVSQTYYVFHYVPDSQKNYNWNFTPAANTWTKITKTIPGASGVTFNNDNGPGMSIQIVAYYGNDFTASTDPAQNQWFAWSGTNRIPNMTNTWGGTTNATLEVTGMQLEVGPVATPFEHRSAGEELRRCERYFQCLKGPNLIDSGTSEACIGTGMAYASNRVLFPLIFKTEMRSNPTVAVNTQADLQALGVSGGWNSSTGFNTTNNFNTMGGRIDMTFSGSPLTAGHAAEVRLVGSGLVSFDAEF